MNTLELFDLKGKVAIVTGGNKGLGRNFAQALAECGANIVIAARKKELCETAAKEIEKIGVKALGLQCDITKEDEVKQMVDKVVSEFGKIDILVNNSGRFWAALAEDIELKNWQKVMDLNVNGTFLVSQAVGRVMIKQNYGKIINIASTAGLQGSYTKGMNNIAYNTSKGAIINFTRDLACKWAQYNINVNTIAPGWIKNDFSGELLDKGNEEFLKNIPLGRFGKQEDLSGAVVYLSSGASNFVTGTTLVIDGGMTCH